MKKVNIISTVVQRKISGEKIPTGNNVTLNGVVDIDEIRKELSKNFISFDDFKSYWEIKTDAYGNKYIYSPLHIATQNGITMYAGKDGVNIPSIYDGLPIDSQTIYWEDIKDDSGVVIGKILKAKTGGGTLGSLTNVGEWADSVASVDRIMVQKQGSDKWVAMDASKLGISASFENIFETGEGNAYTSFTLSDDKKSLSLVKGQTFITASKSEDITGIKNFINGLQINGVELKYDSSNNALYIQKSDGSPVNFYSTGGISMYGQGDTSVKTIMDAIVNNLDRNTLDVQNGLITVVGGGGIESITQQMVIDALGFTPYDASNPNGYLTSASLGNYATKTDLSGYLPLSGGELNNSLTIASDKNNSSNKLRIGSSHNTYYGGEYIWIELNVNGSLKSNIVMTESKLYFKNNIVFHAGNFNPANYLPLSGGTLTASGFGNALCITRQETGSSSVIKFADSSQLLGYIGIAGTTHALAGHPMVTLNSTDYKLWHSGNDGSGSGLDADMLDGVHASELCQFNNEVDLGGTTANYDTLIVRYSNTSSTSNHPYSIVGGNQCVALNLYAGTDFAAQLAMGFGNNYLAYRNKHNTTTWNEWRKISAGFADVATKLSDNTSFTIWGQTFFENGKPKNVSGDISLNKNAILNHKAWKMLFDTNDCLLLGHDYALNGLPSYIDGYNLFLRTGKDLKNSVYIENTGNVGIGTNSPSTKLHVIQSNWDNGITIDRSVSGLGASIRVNSNGTYIGNFGISGTRIFEINLNDGSNLKNVFVVNSSGNVGIGTTSPLDKLHVAGNLRLKNEDSYYGNYIYFGDDRYCYIGETTDDSMTIYASKGIQLNGKVNIASDTTIDGNLLVRGGITMYSTDGNVTPFLIDVQNWELIDSMSVTQVYTAHVTTLLKKKVKEFGEDVTELSKSLDSKIRTIKASLQNITSSSSVSAIGTALNTLYNSL